MTAPYGWIIIADAIADPKHPAGTNSNAVGVVGPRNIAPALDAQLKAGKGRAFRMLDDDGELYYQGRIVGEYEGLEPLEDFGTPNAGATTLQMLEHGRQWVTI